MAQPAEAAALPAGRLDSETYLYSKAHAHGALFVFSVLMLFDYIDRQILASLLPFIKAEWQLSDTQLGALVAAVNVAIAILALPTAVWADKWSRTKSAGIMAVVWSLATGACGLAINFWQMLAARFVIGAGEAGYTAAGNSMIAAVYPKRQRSTMIGLFQSVALFGSVVGVVLGGFIGVRLGWRYAFGLVALPGLLFAIVLFFVRDYENAPAPASAGSVAGAAPWTTYVKEMFRKPVLWFVYLGSAIQFFVIATVGNWMPSFFNRVYGLPVDQAGLRTGVFVLCSALGVIAGGWFADRLVAKSPNRRLSLPAMFSVLTAALFIAAFSQRPGPLQLALMYAGAFVMVAILSPVITVIQELVPPAMRSTSTGAMVTCNNLFGMALGPLVLGIVSDQTNLATAMLLISFVPLLAALAFFKAIPMVARELDAMRPGGGFQVASSRAATP